MILPPGPGTMSRTSDAPLALADGAVTRKSAVIRAMLPASLRASPLRLNAMALPPSRRLRRAEPLTARQHVKGSGLAFEQRRGHQEPLPLSRQSRSPQPALLQYESMFFACAAGTPAARP